ncbi:MAG: 50S ribosomal protein L23 [Candidatus Paceibacterota bacterium]|jgi:large subunit ribosomal protein L23
MPLFGFRTHKKYDKDFSQSKAVKAGKNKESRSKKVEKVIPIANKVVNKAIQAPVIRNIIDSFDTSAETIIRPHITEKTGILSQGGVYTFQVKRDANKQTVSKAIKALYKVNPIKVAMINVGAKNIFVRGKKGTVSGMRKAIVTLKKGEKIDFI